MAEQFTPPPLSSWEGPAEKAAPPASSTTAPESIQKDKGNWFAQNAPKAKTQAPPRLDRDVKTASSKEPKPKKHQIPPGTPIQGGPILPEAGIIFSAAAMTLDKLDKALGLTGVDKNGRKILGGPVTPKPGDLASGGLIDRAKGPTSVQSFGKIKPIDGSAKLLFDWAEKHGIPKSKTTAPPPVEKPVSRPTEPPPTAEAKVPVETPSKTKPPLWEKAKAAAKEPVKPVEPTTPEPTTTRLTSQEMPELTKAIQSKPASDKAVDIPVSELKNLYKEGYKHDPERLETAKKATSPDQFPPVVIDVFKDGTYRLGDGMHRVKAAIDNGFPNAKVRFNFTDKGTGYKPYQPEGELTPRAFSSGFASGKTSTAKVARGYKVPFKYAVVDADNLITSNSHETLEPNPAYDQSIQPRDRTRAGYADQINTMVGTLDPEELGHSYKASDGSPIVGEDGMVESGNGRTIALKRVYGGNTPKASEYRDWIKENAKDFGIDPSSIESIKNPVLVRVRTGLPEGVSRQEFAQHANEDAKATMGAVETATQDSSALTPDVMKLFSPSETGDINTAANRPFVQKFAQQIVGPGQKNPFQLADGNISSECVRRIKNAIFSKAYGGSTALEKLAEDPNDNTKTITNGLVIAAPKFADMQAGIDRGDLYNLNPSQAIGRAVSRLTHLREQKQTIQDFLNQEDLYGKDPVEGAILDIFDKHKRSARAISSVFKNYVDLVEDVGSPKQQSMFAGEQPTIFELLEAASAKLKADVRPEESSENAPPLLEEQAGSGGEVAGVAGKAQ